MRKIKIIGKGLPKFQQQPGTFTAGKMGIHNLQIDVPCPVGFKKDESGRCIKDPMFDESTIDRPAPDANDDTSQLPSAEAQRFSAVIGGMSAQDLDRLWSSPKVQEQQPKQKTLTGPQLAMLSTGMMSEVADQLQRSDLQSRVNKTTRRMGQTDMKFPSMRNVYSYGRTPTGYSYRQMVPVQFAGAPTFEAMTFPQFAQDGIEVTRDILQMPTLYTSDPSAPGLYAQDPAIQEAMTRRYADVQLPSDTAPVQASSVDFTALIAPPVVGPEAAIAPVTSKKGSKEISYSHNNPLNIHYGKFTSSYGATKGAYDNMGNVAIFPNLNSGVQAAKDLLFSPKSAYYNLRISEARNRWVNGDVDQPSESTRHIVKAMGKDTYISQLTPPEKDKLLKLFAKWEGKQGYNAIKDMQLFKEGGVYELDDNEIQQILANGGQVQYL